MHITYIVQRTLPSPLTGSERYIHELARIMGEHYSTEIIATVGSQISESTQIFDGVCIKTFKEFPINKVTSPISNGIRRLDRQKLLDVYSEILFGFLHSTSWGYFSLSMKEYLKSHNFELIHSAAIPTATAWLSWRISKKKKIPFVFTPFLHYELMDFKVPWVKKMLRESSTVIAVTNKEKEKIIEFGVSESKIQVIPLGIDYKIYERIEGNSFRSKKGLLEDLFVILIPRKSKGKGTFDTLKAIVNLSQKYNKIGLILLDKTNPNDEGILGAYIHTLTKNGVKVIDLGFITGQDLVSAYQASDVIVEPTSVDSFGIVFLEAWACGKPVIAADCGPISEIVHDNFNGLLVEFGDSEGLEKSLSSLIDDYKLKKRLGENGKLDVIRKYSIDNMVRNTEHIYNSLLDK